MPRRIEVELTSQRDDGTWTWRAAGAKQPKGVLDGELLYSGAKVGDVVRADAEFDIDGIVVVAVLPPKGARSQPDLLPIIGSGRAEGPLVTTALTGRRDRPRGRDDRGARPPRGDRDHGDRRPRPEGAGGEDRPRRDRPAAERRPRVPAKPPLPPKPKPKRLRPLRTHRNAAISALPEEQRPIAEQLLRGGVPAVRQAIDKQNEQARAEGRPEIAAAPLLALAESLLPAMRTAEWRDRAEAALAEIHDLDLRDLRSVVVAADAGARDNEARELAAQLREGLARRVEEEHAAWLREIVELLDDDRAVRALRLSSRPPKAGSPLPPDLAARLSAAAGAALAADATQERWATVLDAVAFSPVRMTVEPAGVPAEPKEELLAAVRKVASRVPTIAARFGIEVTEAGARRGPATVRKRRPPPPPPARVAATPGPEPAASELDTAAPDTAGADTTRTEVAEAMEPTEPTEHDLGDNVELVIVDARERIDEASESLLEKVHHVVDEVKERFTGEHPPATAQRTDAEQPTDAEPTDADTAVPDEPASEVLEHVEETTEDDVTS